MEEERDGNQPPALTGAVRGVYKDTQVNAWLSDNYATGSNTRGDLPFLIDDQSRKLRFEKIAALYADSDDSDSTDASKEAEPKALDGGYGWVIVFVSFVIHFICDGLSFSFGIMFPEIQLYYNASKFTSGIAASLFLAIPLLGGPLAAALTDIYDCRAMTIVGGIIAAVGVALSYLSQNVWHFTLTFSLIAGLGMCFCYNTAIVIVTYYFSKRRALATGIAVCGSGAGTFFFAPVVEMLIKNFGWRSSILVFSGILSLLVFCGFVMKNVEWPQDTLEYKRKKFIRKMERKKEKELMKSVNELSNTQELSGMRLAVSLPEISTQAWGYLRKVEPSLSMELVKNAVNELEDNVPRSKSVATFTQKKQYPSSRNVFESPVSNHHSHLDLQQSLAAASRRRLISNTSHSLDALDIIQTVPGKMTAKDGNGALCSSEDSKCSNDGESESSSEEDEFDVDANLIQIKPSKGNYAQTVVSGKPVPAANGGAESITNLPEAPTAFIPFNPIHGVARLSSIMGGPIGTTHGRVPPSNAILMSTRHSVFGNRIEKAPSAPALCIRRRRRHPGALQLKRIVDAASEALKQNWELFTVPMFQFFLLSVFILYMFFDIPYVNFPEYAVNHLNVSESESSYLVSGIGLFNMASMLFCGFIADWKYTRDFMLPLYGIFIVCAGLCVLITPHITSFYGMMVICNAYGFFISANYVLASVLTLELLCLHGFQSGYGLLCLVEGLGNVLGPALVGYFHDLTGSYIYIFYFAGGGIVVSGVLVLFIEVYRRYYPEVEAQDDV